MSLIPIFLGYDSRESVAYHALEQSIINRTTAPVAIIPLAQSMLKGFDGQRDGTNAFIYSRFLVPELSDFQGWAIYCDGDMLLRDDLVKVWALRDDRKAVMVVKHDYHTKHARKLIGTPMEAGNQDYPRKNWSSLILWNCGHMANRHVTADYVASAPGSVLHRFAWLPNGLIGELPAAWNHLVGEYSHDPHAKLVHFTAGAPCFSHYRRSDYADEWIRARDDVNHALDKSMLMGAA